MVHPSQVSNSENLGQARQAQEPSWHPRVVENDPRTILPSHEGELTVRPLNPILDRLDD